MNVVTRRVNFPVNSKHADTPHHHGPMPEPWSQNPFVHNCGKVFQASAGHQGDLCRGLTSFESSFGLSQETPAMNLSDDLEQNMTLDRS